MKKWLLYFAGLVGVAVAGAIILFVLWPQSPDLLKISAGAAIGFFYSVWGIKKFDLLP